MHHEFNFSQVLTLPIKERMTFSSMLGKSPGLERKLKLPSPQHITAGISNKVNNDNIEICN